MCWHQILSIIYLLQIYEHLIIQILYFYFYFPSEVELVVRLCKIK